MMATTTASSSTSSTTSKDKKKLEEKTSKLLREVAQLNHNKQCCDCNQKGPTYANVTIGTFVCTTCSGILRGLNPPHRVKSINMATFTPEEVEFLRNHGNHYCKLVYMSLFDSTTGIQPDSRDSEKLRDFLTQKYEKKRWYSAPTDSILSQIKRENDISAKIQQNAKGSPTSSHNSASLKAADAAITHPQQRPHTQRSVDTSNSKILLNFNTNKTTSNNNNNLMTSFDQLSISSNSSGGTINNTNFNFNNFASNFTNTSPGSTSQKATETTSNNNFANFDMFDQFVNSSSNGNVQSTHSNGSALTSGSINFNAFPASVPQQPIVPPLQPMNPSAGSTITTPNNHVTPAAFSQNSKLAQASSDKYSALAELDSIFQPATVAPQTPLVSPAPQLPSANLFAANPFGAQQHFATNAFQTQMPTPVGVAAGSMYYGQNTGSVIPQASNQHSYYPQMNHAAPMFAPQSPTGLQPSQFSLNSNQFFATAAPSPYQTNNTPHTQPVNNPFISIAQQQSQVLKPKSNSSNPFL